MRVKHRNPESAQVIRSVIYSHFDLSSLISMARMQSAQRKKEKLLPTPGKHTVSAPMQPRGSIFRNWFLGEVIFKFDLHGVVHEVGFYQLAQG